MQENKESNDVKQSKGMLWLKRLGVGGFFFFLAKGLVWLAIFFGIGKCAF